VSWLPTLFFLIAFLYSIVGFGGGSSYLAILALAGLPYEQIPVVALICNVIVTVGGFWHFSRAGFVRWKVILPFIALSIPMAYLGGRLNVSKDLFRLLLGFSLLIAAIRMFIPTRALGPVREISWKRAWCVGIPAGGVLGFLAGLAGIGGGIFLSPILIFLRWANAKEAAAASSFFITVNSLSGLAGHIEKSALDFQLIPPLAVAVFLGGQLGSRFGAYKVSNVRLQQILAGFILYVSVKLIGVGL